MLKNKTETKQILNEWRKVLNEGLYDQDPELLEEGWKEIGNTVAALAMAGTALLGNIGSAHSEVSADQLEEVSAACKGFSSSGLSPQDASNLMLSSMRHYIDRNPQIPNVVKQAIAAASSQNEVRLDDRQLEILKKFMEDGVTTYEKLKDNAKAAYEKLKKDYPNGVASLGDNPTDAELGILNDRTSAVNEMIEIAKNWYNAYKTLSGTYNNIEGWDLTGDGNAPTRLEFSVTTENPATGETEYDFKSTVDGWKNVGN